MKRAASCTSTRSRRPAEFACDINALGADFLTLSGHKIGAPKGVGALVRRDAAVPFPEPLIKGGGQERGLRAGTENVAGIAGFGAAAAAALAGLAADGARMAGLRDRLELGLRAACPEVVIFGAGAERLPNTTLFAVAGMKAETAIIAFDLEGVAVSSGRGLFLRQGPALARAGRHGSSPAACARRGAREPRADHHRIRDRLPDSSLD